ncbi:unnamed protein product [Sphagnum troendelagicum]|jgi:hypothetical protein|uniref:Uncharacterized protein n=2 Tax=Sphagnum jensenii TaxID=128206 RepID=A0ABP0X102_9BRYO
MGHLLGHASTDSALTRTSPGGSGLPYFNQGDRILEWNLFLESRYSNGAITKDECKYLNSSDNSFVPQITSNGIVFEGRAQYITLKFLDNENFTIANIYGTRTSNEWALMWKWLSEANFDTSHVIIGGDFNHLEEID